MSKNQLSMSKIVSSSSKKVHFTDLIWPWSISQYLWNPGKNFFVSELILIRCNVQMYLGDILAHTKSYQDWLRIGFAGQISILLYKLLRLKVHPSVPNASLPNLTDFLNRTYQDWSRKIWMYGNLICRQNWNIIPCSK